MLNPLDNPLDLLDEPEAPPQVWKGAGMVAGMVGATVVRKLLDKVRGRVSERGDAPLNTADRRMSWPNALLWAGVIGIGAAVGRLLAQRVVASVWRKRSHAPAQSALPRT